MGQAVDIAFVLLTEAFALGVPNPSSGGMHLLSAIEKTSDLGVPEVEKQAKAAETAPVDNNAAMALFGGMLKGTTFGGATA